VVIGLGFILLVAAIVFVTESTRKLPVQYARRQRTGSVQESFLPLKLNQTGVMPIIFASALLTMPQLVIPVALSLVDPAAPVGAFLNSVSTSFLFDSGSAGYAITYFVLIVIFALFYVFIAFKPDQVAENLQKSGGFIPGIRPGKSTEDHITRVLVRLTSVGAIFLGLIALIPIIAGNLMVRISGNSLRIFSAIGGTSILIVVSVVLEMLRQIDSLRASQNYDKFMK
jgi:preprotein translocase subunit SecY